MEKRVFKKENSDPINQKLVELEKIIQKKDALIKTEEEVINGIRTGFRKRVIIFIDLVDSTKFKVMNTDKPEIWILRLKQFSEIVGEYIEECGGQVVKYIGDEVMGVFERDTRINDAMSLVIRLKEIEKNLYDITNESSKIKIAIDYGDVYLMTFEGHFQSDPQGTPVDRCARIAKYCQPSTVLTSYDFVSNYSYPDQWNEVGEINLKGLGLTKVYQFDKQSVQIENTIEIAESKMKEMQENSQKMKDQIQELSLKLKENETKNKDLSKLLEEHGNAVPDSLKTKNGSKENESKELWKKIQKQMSDLRTIVNEAKVPASEYARFLFLYNTGNSDRWDSFSGKTFETTLEKKLIVEDNSSFYKLNIDHRRNKLAISIMNELESYLNRYESECRDTDDSSNDLFTYSLEDPDFWLNYIGFNVT